MQNLPGIVLIVEVQTQLYTIPANEKFLPTLLGHVGGLGSRVSEYMKLRAQTALEELFANSIKHGYAGATSPTANHIWLAVWMEGDALHVRYEDAAPPFNPFDNLESVVQTTLQPLEERPVGGLGRLMVQRLSNDARYARIDAEATTGAEAHNRIDLVFKEARRSVRDPAR